MSLRIAAITDLHFGPRTMFHGKLRKLSDQAPALTDAFVQRMNAEVHPHLVFALGDLIEDESVEIDRTRYTECLSRLSGLDAPLHVVAGNHDTLNLPEPWLAQAWRRPPPLHYSFDSAGFHFVVLHTREQRDVTVRIDEPQLEWLREDLASTSLPTVIAMHHSAADQDLHGNRWFEKAPHLALVRERVILRKIVAASGNVVLVINGHVHWSRVDVHDGIPYVTVQSLIENVEDDAPGRAASAWAVVELGPSAVSLGIEGAEPARFCYHR